MDILSPELLSSIYLTLLLIPPCDKPMWTDDPDRKRKNALTRIRLVSRWWNDIVLDTPRLWSCIYISSAYLRLDPIRLSLERTRQAPLHIQIHFGDRNEEYHDHRHLIRILKRLWSEAHRWETVAFLGTPFHPWCHLPPGPLPNLREVYLHVWGKFAVPVEIQAPRLEALWETMNLTNIESSGTLALRSWGVYHPSSREEWERFIKVVQNCHQLEWLHFFFHPREYYEALETLEHWRLPKASGGIFFPSLKQFQCTLDPLPVNFLGHIHAPNLQQLIIRHPRLKNPPDTFSLPTRFFELSPKLDAIRFGFLIPLNLIQKCLMAVPNDRIAGMEVEVEHERWFLPQEWKSTEHQKCLVTLNSLCRIQWIPVG